MATKKQAAGVYDPAVTAKKGAAAVLPVLLGALVYLWRVVAPQTVPWDPALDGSVIAAVVTVATSALALVVMFTNWIKNKDRGKGSGGAAAAGLVLAAVLGASLMGSGCTTLEKYGVTKDDVKWAIDTGLKFLAEQDKAGAAVTEWEKKKEAVVKSVSFGAAAYLLDRKNPDPEDRANKAVARAEKFCLTVYKWDLLVIAAEVIGGKPETVSNREILIGLVRAEAERLDAKPASEAAEGFGPDTLLKGAAAGAG